MTKKIDIAKQMKEVKWTTEHTLTETDYRKMILSKFERASTQAELLRRLAQTSKK